MDKRVQKDPILTKEIKEAGIRLEKLEENHSESIEVLLPWWSEDKRGVPNSFLRSALFAAVQGKDRRYINGEMLTSQQGINVKFTGMQLNQTDLDVWEAIVQLVRPYPLGTVSYFSSYQILRMLDLPLGSSQYQQLYESITRLTSGAIHVTHKGKRKGYLGHLVDSGLTDQETDPAKEPPNQYELQLNKNLIKLFGHNQWTAIDWEQRKQIRNKPLALALHAFYSSHKDPFALKVETLHGLVGSEDKDIYKFKYRLKIALSELKEIRFLTKYAIEDDLVHVEKSPIAIVGKRLRSP